MSHSKFGSTYTVAENGISSKNERCHTHCRTLLPFLIQLCWMIFVVKYNYIFFNITFVWSYYPTAPIFTLQKCYKYMFDFIWKLLFSSRRIKFMIVEFVTKINLTANLPNVSSWIKLTLRKISIHLKFYTKNSMKKFNSDIMFSCILYNILRCVF